MKHWVAVDSKKVIVSGFSATESVAEGALVRVSELDPQPDWYSDDLVLVDVTNEPVLPVVGFYMTEAGIWADGNSTLSTDRETIPADGTTVARVTFSQEGPNTPSSVVFNVNGADVTEIVNSSGKAFCEIVSSNPGDLIVVTANETSVTIMVED